MTGKLQTLDEAFVFRKEIDRASYLTMRDKLRTELREAEQILDSVTLADIEIETTLAASNSVLQNTAEIWRTGNVEHRRRLQLAILPDGIEHDGEKFGTAATCLAFNGFGKIPGGADGVASLSIPSWNQVLTFLHQIAKFKEIAGSAA